MLNKICLIVNYNLYESKRHFTQQLAQAMQRQGIETLIIDVRETVIGADTLQAIQAFKPDLTCSFNSLLPLENDKFLWDLLGIPHWSILVDPALYSIHLTKSPLTILSCVDRSDVESVKAYNFNSVFFWPHAIERELELGQQERHYEVVFLGSCYDYESLRVSWQQRNPEGLNKVLDDAIDLVFNNKSVSLTEALIQAWQASKLDPTGVDFTTLFYYLDNYTRGKDRVELIRSIKNVPVHVFGELSTDNAVGILGWSPYLASQSNVTVHPAVRFEESFSILQQSKFCLNSMPFFKNGSHERVLTGLACGALPITTANLYFEEFFREGQELLYYKMDQRAEVNEKIENLLAHEPKRLEIVARGRELVMENHTWDNRVSQLIEELPAIINKLP